MNKKIIALCLLTAMGGIATAQKKAGGISSEMLRKIQQTQVKNTQGKAIANALAANNIDDLAKNRDNAGAIDTYFSVETPKQSIHDQKSSGRCWMFTGFNVLRSNFAQRSDRSTSNTRMPISSSGTSSKRPISCCKASSTMPTNPSKTRSFSSFSKTPSTTEVPSAEFPTLQTNTDWFP